LQPSRLRATSTARNWIRGTAAEQLMHKKYHRTAENNKNVAKLKMNTSLKPNESV